MIPRQIQGSSFFPAGVGLVRAAGEPLPKLPVGGIMVLAHDWGTVKDFERYSERDAESLSNPTWKRLLSFFDSVEIERRDCFYTNFFVGLRSGSSSVGTFPGILDEAYVAECLSLVAEQVELQKPRLMLVLGAHVPRLLARGSEQLHQWVGFDTFKTLDREDASFVPRVRLQDGSHQFAAVSLVHPCYRQLTARHRRWRGYNGDRAEVELVKHALLSVEPKPHTADAQPVNP